MAKIMVVDDSATVRAQVSRALTQAGFETVQAVDGLDAFNKVTTSDADVALIVCDVNMPNMDGLTFLKNIKASPTHKFTPVIMLTTESQEAKKAEGKAAGVKAWVVKPFKPAEMLVAVSKLIAP